MSHTENHKQWVSEVFDRAAPAYGTKSSSFFTYFGERLVKQVKVLPGQHILDVATGRGSTLFPLAEAVGPSGKVVGIDISPQMLKETSKEALEKGLHWVELHHMDAEHLLFPDCSFDFIFCGFGLFFFPSVLTALAEFKRVLKPGGTLITSIWGEDSELGALINAEIKAAGNTQGLAATQLYSEQALFKVLEEANFTEIQIAEETKTFLHHTAEEYWDSLWNHGTRAKLEQLSSDQIAGIREKVLNKGDSIPESLQVFYGIVKKD